MLEYLSLIGQVKREDLPLRERLGMLDILSRITQYMSPEQFREYSTAADQVRLQTRGQFSAVLRSPFDER